MRDKFLHILGLLFLTTLPAFGIDREAFTFTRYDLDARIEPGQQRLGVRVTSRCGMIRILRKRSRFCRFHRRSTGDRFAEEKQLQFVSQPYTSDVDHTGSLSEAIVTLPRELKQKESIEIEIGYEGTIPLDQRG